MALVIDLCDRLFSHIQRRVFLLPSCFIFAQLLGIDFVTTIRSAGQPTAGVGHGLIDTHVMGK